MKLKFCGAAQSVTGSSYLLTYEGGKLLVDCGMRQGADTKGALGEGGFAFEPAEIDAVLLTHAHIDHSGLLPLLVKRGFKGKIVSTSATARLATIMLPDSGHIQEQEAEYQNRKNLRAGKPAVEPLYTVKDAANSLKAFAPVEYNETVTVLEGVTARFVDAGHLLGSASVEVWVKENGKTVKLAFSGDIGRSDRPIIADPTPIDSADFLIMEGTYGDRNHESTGVAKESQLAAILKAAMARGGNIVIPSFAVGRTQELLYYIKRLLMKNAVPGLERVPVYLDSPLGIEATKVYEECASGYYDAEALQMLKSGSPFEFPNLRVAQSAEDSKLINAMKGTNIIISSSGMCDAGRIRHHLKHNLYRADSTVIFTGYQAVGTLGRTLLDGAKKVKLFGEEVRVNATIERIEGFSGHAGRDELIEWLGAMQQKPEKVYFIHGEGEALASLSKAVASLGYHVEVPSLFEEIDLVTAEHTTAPAPQTAPALKPVSHEAAAERAARIAAQAKRVMALLDALGGESSETELKLSIMEKDVTQLADKWEEILKG
ncbi:MAG: MBL fold metallo-hydrolase [Clostridiaceae bacterium]